MLTSRPSHYLCYVTLTATARSAPPLCLTPSATPLHPHCISISKVLSAMGMVSWLLSLLIWDFTKSLSTSHIFKIQKENKSLEKSYKSQIFGKRDPEIEILQIRSPFCILVLVVQKLRKPIRHQMESQTLLKSWYWRTFLPPPTSSLPPGPLAHTSR